MRCVQAEENSLSRSGQNFPAKKGMVSFNSTTTTTSRFFDAAASSSSTSTSFLSFSFVQLLARSSTKRGSGVLRCESHTIACVCPLSRKTKSLFHFFFLLAKTTSLTLTSTTSTTPSSSFSSSSGDPLLHARRGLPDHEGGPRRDRIRQPFLPVDGRDGR